MSKTFICLCCGGRHNKNPRLKIVQRYCGSKRCQQQRKNLWEKERLRDPKYKTKRQASKRRWYLNYPGNKYQSEYRESHPDYCKENRRQQVFRNENRKITTSAPKIVKTDTLTSESVAPQGYYVLLPYEKAVEKTDAKKIVKTDTLIVQIVARTGFAGDLLPNSS